MNLTPPKGALTVLSITWIIFALLAVILLFLPNSPMSIGFAIVAVVIGIASAMLWKESTDAAKVLIFLFALSILLAIPALLMKDQSWTERIIRIGKMAMTGYFIQVLWVWKENKMGANRVAGSINAPRPHTTGHTGP